MAFKTPIDYGFAQVMDNSGLVNAYMQQQVAHQKEKQAREKEMADQLAKIKPDGIKEADIPEIETRYKNLQGLYHKAASSNSLKDKAEYDAGVRQMMYDIEKSKNSQNLYADLLKHKGANKDRLLYQDFDTRLDMIKNIPTFSQDYQTATNDVSSMYSTRKTVDLMNDVFSPIVKESYITSTPVKTKDGEGYKITSSKSASPSFIGENIAAAMLSNPDVSDKIFETYSAPYTQTNKQHDIAEAKQRGFKNYDPNSFKDYVALQVLRTAKDKQDDAQFRGDGKTNITVNYSNGDQRLKAGNAVENQPIPFTNAKELDKSGNPLKENTVARKWLAVNGEVDVNTYGGINLDTGDKYTDKDVISGKVIGIGELPFLKKTGGFVKDRHVNQVEKIKGLDWKDVFIVAVKDKYGNTTRVAVPLSQYPLGDVWSEKYKEIGLKGQVQGANVDATKGNTDRLNRIQTELKSKKTPKPEAEKTVKYMVGSEEYEIPSNLVSKFIAKYPKAKKK